MISFRTRGRRGDLLHNLPLVSSPLPRVMMLQDVHMATLCVACLWPIISLSLDLRSFSIVGIFTSPQYQHICAQNCSKMFGHDRTWTCIWCPTGLEPAISRSEVWCIIHYATSCSTSWATWPVRATWQKSLLLTQRCNMQRKVKVAPPLKCLCKESRCYAQLQICVFCVADRGLGLVSLIWTQDQTKQSLSLYSIPNIIKWNIGGLIK